MAEIEDLVGDVADPSLRIRLAREIKQLKQSKSFGLVFERHIPETVALRGMPIHEGMIVQNRHAADAEQFVVKSVQGGEVRVTPRGSDEVVTAFVRDDLLVVRRIGESIYPGLRRVDAIRRANDEKPAHVVINGENTHALQLLDYALAGSVDCIYIDPPYNSGSRDWKYNNNYVDAEDEYRHSKWLAFMERRLRLAKDLLSPEDSILIVTIDEREYLRLGLLLEQVFPGSKVQMVSSVINPAGTGRHNEFSRTNEYLFVVMVGSPTIQPMKSEDAKPRPVTWETLRRRDLASKRGTSKGGPAQFYPIYVDEDSGRIVGTGEPLSHDVDRSTAPDREGCTTVLPVRDDGTEMNWGLTSDELMRRVAKGYVRVGKHTPSKPQKYVITYLRAGPISDVEEGRAVVTGRRSDGSVIASYPEGKEKMPTTQWEFPSHDAQRYGTNLLSALIPNRRFPFPKSLYAVEDILRIFIGHKPEAVVVDFFAGSGTTGHAVARLNQEDGGVRRSIQITNNEVSADEAKALRAAGHSPGDPEWEEQGIFVHVTMPRMKAAISGQTPGGDAVKGEYRGAVVRPVADGLPENVEFLEIQYLERDSVDLGRQFNAIAPVLWLTAGCVGEYEEWDGVSPWSLPKSSTYGVLFEEDQMNEFAEALEEHGNCSHVWLVTNSHSSFVELRGLFAGDQDVRQLYRDYLRHFDHEVVGRLS